jgi:aspartate aminotransferase
VAGNVIGDSMALSSRLLDDVGVATVAGKAFGSDDCIRLSYATSAERIEEGLRRIAEFIGRLD